MDKSVSRPRVLVVEDEMMVLLFIEDVLREFGCESVTAAATVDQALALIEAHTFDLAMLDVNLNGHRSYPVADALAARRVPFFFSTGYCDHVGDVYPDRPVLRKPFSCEKLVEMVTRLLSR
jgi:CheY-like chemotaxis protein